MSVDITVSTVKWSTIIIKLDKPDYAVTLHGNQGQECSQLSGKVHIGPRMLPGIHTVLSPNHLFLLCESALFLPLLEGCLILLQVAKQKTTSLVPEYRCYMSSHLWTISLISVDLIPF